MIFCLDGAIHIHPGSIAVHVEGPRLLSAPALALDQHQRRSLRFMTSLGFAGRKGRRQGRDKPGVLRTLLFGQNHKCQTVIDSSLRLRLHLRFWRRHLVNACDERYTLWRDQTVVRRAGRKFRYRQMNLLVVPQTAQVYLTTRSISPRSDACYS
jgi:hypothetical protein